MGTGRTARAFGRLVVGTFVGSQGLGQNVGVRVVLERPYQKNAIEGKGKESGTLKPGING